MQEYQRSLSLAEAGRDEVLLAYALNDRPLEPQHGYPVRLLVSGWYGMRNVKWLRRIDAVAERFEGYQMADAYRYTSSGESRGEPVSLQYLKIHQPRPLLRLPVQWHTLF